MHIRFISFYYLVFILCLITRPLPAQVTTTPGSTANASPTTKIEGTDVSIPTVLLTPGIVPGISPNNTTNNPTPAKDQSTVLLGGLKPSAGKYEEYQSICRDNEFDQVFYYNEPLKAKRIAILEGKAQDQNAPSYVKFRLLKELFDQKKTKEFEKYYSDLKSDKLSDSDRKMLEAYHLTAKGDYKKAEQLLVSLLSQEAKNKEAMKQLASIYRLDQNYFEASTLFEDLTKLTHEKYNEQLCQIFVLDSQHSEAEQTCQAARLEDKDNPYPLIFLGVSFREKLNHERALQLFQDSLKIKETEMAYSCLGEMFFIKNKFELSESYFKKGLLVSPLSYRALIGLGWTQIKNKKFEQALLTFKKACSIQPKTKSELKKVYKYLLDEKYSSSSDFIKAAESCAG